MSKIEWTDKTWNVITGCTQISPACQNCYAKAMTKRLQGMAKKGIKGSEKYIKGWDSVEFHTDMLGHIFDKSKYPSGCKVFVKWVEDIYLQCRKTDTPFFFKQWGDGEAKNKVRVKGDDITLCEVIESKKSFHNK